MAKKKARQIGPGRDGQKIIIVAESDDPFDGGGGLTMRQRVISHDTLRLLSMRGTLEQNHIRAGILYGRDFERSKIGGGGSIDPTRGAGAKGAKPEMSWRQLDAIQTVNDVIEELGVVNCLIVNAICLENLTLPELQNKFSSPPLRWPKSDYAGARVREAFEILANAYTGRK